MRSVPLRSNRTASNPRFATIMSTYIVRRLLLMIPTLFAIMVINFVIIQVAPGGPVEQIISQLTGVGTAITDRVTRTGTSETLSSAGSSDAFGGKYRGAQGLDPDFILSLIHI